MRRPHLAFAAPRTGNALIEIGVGNVPYQPGWRFGVYVCSPTGYCADDAYVVLGFCLNRWPGNWIYRPIS